MIASTIKSPGVYIQEINAFPNSVVPVATAVPAFIGYTPQATYQGQNFINKTTLITSFADFQAIFCYQDDATGATKQYNPQYYLTPQKGRLGNGDYIQVDDTPYALTPDPDTIYYLYNSVRLFYNNGGGNAYIVSVGTYGPASNKAAAAGAQIINSNVKLADLLAGLELLKNEPEPTMYICPDATLLSIADNATLMQQMLQLNTVMQTAISIFDIIGGNTPNPLTFMKDIDTFRKSTGTVGLSYGTAYYPFVGTNVMQPSELNYTNLFGGDTKQLAKLLGAQSKPSPALATILTNIQKLATALTVVQNNNALLAVSPTYAVIMQHVLAAANLLPPSGGMAGVMTTIDNETGVWQAPANTGIIGVISLPIKLSDTQQGPLNVDAVSGKSINAIRYFNNYGILIWGARTLDGNSQDWKYLPVRRTITYIEQSCKLAAQAYVFEPNNKNTWEAVKAMIGSFLADVWKQGGLSGSKAADAFSVDCGLGITMTADDILNGYMNVTVKIAPTHPAEFIVLTFQQQMAVS
jgi:phage tail sheath protein FI